MWKMNSCILFLLNLFLQGIYHRLGDTFSRLQQWSEAERFHRAAIEAQPDHIAAHLSYGTMLARNVSFIVLFFVDLLWKIIFFCFVFCF